MLLAACVSLFCSRSCTIIKKKFTVVTAAVSVPALVRPRPCHTWPPSDVDTIWQTLTRTPTYSVQIAGLFTRHGISAVWPHDSSAASVFPWEPSVVLRRRETRGREAETLRLTLSAIFFSHLSLPSFIGSCSLDTVSDPREHDSYFLETLIFVLTIFAYSINIIAFYKLQVSGDAHILDLCN